MSGVTYLAEVADDSCSDLPSGTRVVIKTPWIVTSNMVQRIEEVLRELSSRLEDEAYALGRLEGLPNVAQVLDMGKYERRIADHKLFPNFIVQQLIDGKLLAEYMVGLFAVNANRFSGIPDSETY